MRELKRVFSPRLLLFLLLLCAVSFAAQRLAFTAPEGFRAEYTDMLEAFSVLTPEERTAELERFRTQAQINNAILAYEASEGEMKAYYASVCEELLGKNWKNEAPEIDAAAFFARQQAFSQIEAQLKYLAEYGEYLDTVHQNAKQMGGLAIFGRGGNHAFSERNLKKTDADFPQRGEIEPVLTNTLGIDAFLSDRVSGVCLFLWLAGILLTFFTERGNGLSLLLYGTPGGRERLSVKRTGILLLASVLGTVLICGTALASDLILYGVPDLSSLVQSSELFKTFTYRLSFLQFLILFFIVKAFGAWAAAHILRLLMQYVGHPQTALSVTGAITLAEYALFTLIPDSFSLVFLRYLNLFALIAPQRVLLKYLNLNLFSFPVRGAALTLLLIPVAAASCASAAAVHAARIRPIRSDGKLLRFYNGKILPVIAKAFSCFGAFGNELKKALWYQKGLAAVMLLLLWCFFFAERPPVDTSMFDVSLAAVQNEFQGPVTDEMLDRIRSAEAEAEALPKSEYRAMRLAVLADIKAEAQEKLGTNLQIVNPAPVCALVTTNRDYQRLNAAVSMLAVSLLCAGLFAYENQNKARALLRTAKHGRSKLTREKLAVAVLCAVFVWATVSGREIALCARFFESAIPLNASVRSIAFFSALPEIPIGVFLAFYYLIRLAALIAAAMLSCLISVRCKTVKQSMLVCAAVLALPPLLSRLGLSVADYFSFAELLSPVKIL
mgnify:CR=1 FL=1